MNSIKGMFMDHARNRKLLLSMSMRDFKSKYVGSYLGILWAFIQPSAMILIYWFIFQVGFKSAPVNDIPYILYFICSIIPWFYFSEALSSATNSVIDNPHLVKKVLFPVSILPGIRAISSLFIHIFFIVIAFLILFLYGIPVQWQLLQLPYYTVACFILVLAMSWITSSIAVFFRDTSQIIAMVLQFGFWLTPIFWNIKMMPDKYHVFIKFLPMYYIVEGYRNSLINGTWFWENDLYLTTVFWTFGVITLVVGAILKKKLAQHYPDVL